ncbi:MAG: ABC transporter ATP-binding protein [Steroidobacteraceae bacterium]|jgi:ABC-2 type transport system ATP-binding protein|nr:ABC transporter ATP-binding protein [Steroidobacteraceae bacterium]
MIEVNHLTKRYGDVLAVDDLSFGVAPGEILGFLGPNGAGKSTTMRIVAGFVAPTAGTARVCGHDVARAPLAARRALGYLPEGAPSYPEMTPRAFLGFCADVRGLAGDLRRRRLDDTVERLGLGPVLERPIETLSKGFRRRVGLAQAILHDPPVLVLDEPTDGLDPNQKHEVRTLIRGMAAGKTIVISTHILEEVDALCTRAVVIARGRLLADAPPRELEARSRYHGAVTLRLADAGQFERARAALAALPDVADVEVDARESRLTALPRAGRPILPVIGELAAHEGLSLRELHLESGRLDEVFRAITNPGTDGRAHAAAPATASPRVADATVETRS